MNSTTNQDLDIQEILAVEFKSIGLSEKVTIKEYLKELLRTLWQQAETFSGKRPFGNSYWQHEVFEALVKHGYIAGKLDENGYIEEYDEDSADKLILELIDAL